jgi:hypothetical protein
MGPQSLLHDPRFSAAARLPHDLSEQPLGDGLLSLVVLPHLVWMVA